MSSDISRTLSVSTSWLSTKQRDAYSIAQKIKGLGLHRIELDFRLSPDMVRGFIEMKRRGDLEITSVHNFSPMPGTGDIVYPDTFSLSSADEDERASAVKYTSASIDTAAESGAGVLILHLGKVDIEDRTRELAFAVSSGTGDPAKIRGDMIKEREAKADPYVDSVRRSLDGLIKYAQRRDVRLAAENRFYYREIPSAVEAADLLGEFSGGLWYWHDTGHAQVMENTGMAGHKDYLDLCGKKMIGMHLHDVIGVDRDHSPCGSGNVDFSVLQEYLNAYNIIKVIEVHQPHGDEEFVRGLKYLTDLMGE